MALISTHSVTTAGTAPTFAAAASGDTARAGEDHVLIVRNANAASRTVTIVVPGNNSYAQANPDPVYTVAALTGEVWIPLLPAYRDPADNQIHITYSATADVTRAVVRL